MHSRLNLNRNCTSGLFIRNDTLQPDCQTEKIEPKSSKLIIFTLQQKDEPCFWEGEIKCSYQFISNQVRSEKGNPQSTVSLSEDARPKPVQEKAGFVFIRVKKSADLRVF